MAKQINTNIKDNLDEEFRRVIAQTKGVRKGAMAEAITEALELWIAKNEKR